MKFKVIIDLWCISFITQCDIYDSIGYKGNHNKIFHLWSTRSYETKCTQYIDVLGLLRWILLSFGSVFDPFLISKTTWFYCYHVWYACLYFSLVFFFAWYFVFTCVLLNFGFWYGYKLYKTTNFICDFAKRFHEKNEKNEKTPVSLWWEDPVATNLSSSYWILATKQFLSLFLDLHIINFEKSINFASRDFSCCLFSSQPFKLPSLSLFLQSFLVMRVCLAYCCIYKQIIIYSAKK